MYASRIYFQLVFPLVLSCCGSLAHSCSVWKAFSFLPCLLLVFLFFSGCSVVGESSPSHIKCGQASVIEKWLEAFSDAQKECDFKVSKSQVLILNLVFDSSSREQSCMTWTCQWLKKPSQESQQYGWEKFGTKLKNYLTFKKYVKYSKFHKKIETFSIS